MTSALPDGVLLAFYGDDFTGSTDAMEVMTFAGLPTVLFLEPPSDAELARFAGYRGIGIAGTARSRTPQWMDEQLPAIFAQLAALKAPVLHYKVCSTFDSSPVSGSIGHAAELGLQATGQRWAACVVGAPRLRRYQAFGNLFAAVDGIGYRLDRHPTMAHHPVTPMHEADLRRHLAAQTTLPTGLVDLVAMKGGRGAEALAAARAQGGIVLLDVLDEETLRIAGELLWTQRGDGLFAAASSGLQYALTEYWRWAGLLPAAVPVADAGPAGPLLVVSGSCSPGTAQQIAWAGAHGFLEVRLDGTALIDPARDAGEIARGIAAVDAALDAGRDVIAFTATGPGDPAIEQVRAAADAAGLDQAPAQQRLAQALGRVLAEVTHRRRLARVMVAGGDTSGFAAGQLGILALEAIMPLAPGSPLCRAHLRDDPARRLEIVLKGGQVGAADFFGRVKQGSMAA